MQKSVHKLVTRSNRNQEENISLNVLNVLIVGLLHYFTGIVKCCNIILYDWILEGAVVQLCIKFFKFYKCMDWNTYPVLQF